VALVAGLAGAVIGGLVVAAGDATLCRPGDTAPVDRLDQLFTR
jgi:hypothetical protein